jgi:hypothetical protein
MAAARRGLSVALLLSASSPMSSLPVVIAGVLTGPGGDCVRITLVVLTGSLARGETPDALNEVILAERADEMRGR